jgi:O-6-methylguanine DNA methyltransferase
MPNWTLVESTLSDNLPMRIFVAELDGRIHATAMHDDEHPRTEDEFLWRIGNGKWERREAGSGPDVLRAAVTQVLEYFAGRRRAFDLPLSLRGTPFQIRVWTELMQVPFGTTCSYGDLAAAIDHPKAFRAVGSANGRNNLPLFIPCHRVIAAAGKLGGFTGGIGLKKRLLAHEAAVLSKRSAA